MKSKNGFTLVELLAVISILAILVLIAMPNILKLFNQARINTNLIVAENYVSAGEQYYAKQFGENDAFTGVTNISDKLNMSGRRADEEKVFVNKDGDVAVYLKIDGDCYYKPLGAEKPQYTSNLEYCDATLYMAGTPVIPVEDGDGLYFDPDKNKITYKSDDGLISGKIGKTYCSLSVSRWDSGGVAKINGTPDCEDYYVGTNVYYSDLTHNEDNINNWIYFNCKDEKDVSTCEKWRIVSYQYTDGGGNLLLISEDLRDVHYVGEDADTIHTSGKELINNYNKLYYDELLSDSAKSLIKKTKYYTGNLESDGSYEVTFSNGVYQHKTYWNLSSIGNKYEESYTSHLNVREWFEASTNEDICPNGQELYSSYSVDINEIKFSECNNWLNDGSFFVLNNGAFVGELGTISTNGSPVDGERPVVTLKDDAQIISGDGSISNPYVLRYENYSHSDTFKEIFLKRIRQLYNEAESSTLNTLYSKSDKYKLDGFDDLDYVIQKEDGKINSFYVYDNTKNLYEINKHDNFDKISEDEIIYKKSNYLIGKYSYWSWYNFCSGSNNLNCKMVQTNAAQLNSNIYSDENNDGLGDRLYYYSYNRSERGNLIFAGYCWRIVRSDEEGNIRVYYNGIPTDGTCPSYFNSSIGSGGLSGYNYVKTTGESSSAKTIVDNWYVNNILPKGNSVTNKIANAIYCNDRANSGYNYNFSCLKDDQFTLKVDKGGVSGFGNNLLDYPVALPNAEELNLSGMNYNNSYYYPSEYLGGRVEYITMTRTGSTYYQVKELYHNNAPYNRVGTAYYNYIIPAITIKGDTQVTSGSGTTSSPFIIN